jgi:hypothetical protein
LLAHNGVPHGEIIYKKEFDELLDGKLFTNKFIFYGVHE